MELRGVGGGAAASEGLEGGGKVRTYTLALLALIVVLIVLLMGARPAHAVSTFTVNQTGDQVDANLADNVCDTNLAAFPRGLQCTLRAAIQEANDTANSGGPDLIRFAIGGTAGVKTISPNSELPDITQPVTIDGYTQRPCSSNPAPCSRTNTSEVGTNAVLLIELNGDNVADANGFTITGGGTTIRGLVINRFNQDDAGLFNGCGIFLPNLAPNTNNVIEGNFIGTDSSGNQDLGNELPGVLSFDQSTGNRIGGPDLEDRNLISGNDRDGVAIASSQNVVRNNLIGTTKSGTGNLGNGGSGVEVVGVGSVVLDNTIAFNGKDGFSDGVTVGSDASTNNRFLRNSIFNNGGLGINLIGGTENAAGATANDGGAADDADSGPNGLQNKPSLTSAITSGGTTTVQGVLDTKPDTTFTVQLFSNGSGNEGKTLVGSKQVPTDSDGRVTFTFNLNDPIAAGQNLTATATGPEGTSEFSATRTVVTP